MPSADHKGSSPSQHRSASASPAARHTDTRDVFYTPTTTAYRKRRRIQWEQQRKQKERAARQARQQQAKQAKQHRQRLKQQKTEQRRQQCTQTARPQTFNPRLVEAVYRILLTLTVLAALFYASSAFFRVRTIKISGCEQCAPTLAAEATGVKIGDRLFFIRRRSVADGIFDALPYADSVRIRLELPSTLSIEITETSPVGAILSNGVAYLIDKNCKLLEYQPTTSCTQTLLIDGLSVGSTTLGREIVLSNQLYIDSLSALLDSLDEEALLPAVTRIDMSKLYNISFRYDGRLTVVIGDASELTRKLELFKEVQSQIGNQVRGALDLSETGRVTFTADG